MLFLKVRIPFIILLYYSCSVLKGLIIVVYQRHRNRLLSLTPYRLNPSRDSTQSSSLIKTLIDIKTSLFVGVPACVSISLLVLNGILNKVKSVL